MLCGFIIKFTGSFMDLLLPWTLAHMIDEVIPAGRINHIVLWGIFMVLCSILAVTFNIIANRMAARVSGDAVYALREDLFKKTMYLSSHQIDSITRPSLISRLTSDTYHVYQMMARMQRLGVRAPILLLGGIAMTLFMDAALAIVLISTLPLLALIVAFVSKKSIPMYHVLQKQTDRFVRLIREDITGIRVIKALSKEDYERQRFDQVNRDVVTWERRAVMVSSITNPAMNFLLNLGLVAVICAGAIRVSRGISQVGTLLAFLSYFTIILTALLSISKMFTIISKAAASADRIMAVLEVTDESELEALFSQEEKTEKPPHLQFDNVSFSYNKTQTNLEHISFSLEQGETLGIIGATGAGKSTIVNLLLHLYDTDSGTILMNGKDIRTMKLKELRSRFGVVFQNDTVFEDTIFENIQLGRPLKKEEAWKAAALAQADAFIREKGGMDEKLEIRGANLSGGQKQRLLIARALAMKPEVLILDDSSSALDYKTDGKLRQMLRQYYSDTTCIIIAQRISSIKDASHILVLDKGRTIGYGSHQELMEHCPVYRGIAALQMGV